MTTTQDSHQTEKVYEELNTLINELASHCFLKREKHFYRVPKRTRMSLAERKAVSRCGVMRGKRLHSLMLQFYYFGSS